MHSIKKKQNYIKSHKKLQKILNMKDHNNKNNQKVYCQNII